MIERIIDFIFIAGLRFMMVILFITGIVICASLIYVIIKPLIKFIW